jgi:hypothetical protein
MQKEMIMSISGSLRRNLNGFPLEPGLKTDQRIEIMNKVREATKKLDISIRLEG